MALPTVFCVMGHGCDLVGVRHKVPPDCTYVTLEICGRGAWELPKLYAAFQNGTLCIPLMFPEIPEFLAILEEYFGISGSRSITVHTTGDEYTESKNTFESNTPPIFWKSGLYGLGNTPNLANGTILFDTSVSGPVHMDDIYSHSLIPHGQPALTIGELMDKQPGIYYNFACRTPCDVATAPLVTIARQQSFALKVAKNPAHVRHSPHLYATYNDQSYPAGKEHELHTYRIQGRSNLFWKTMMEEFRSWHSSTETPAKQYLRIQRLLPILQQMARTPQYIQKLNFGFQVLYSSFYTLSATYRDHDWVLVCDELDKLAKIILSPNLHRVRGELVHDPNINMLGGYTKKNTLRRGKLTKSAKNKKKLYSLLM